MSEDNSGDEKELDKPLVAKTAVDLQRLKLLKLMKNPDKPVIIPERPKIKSTPSVPEFVRNVMGSSAGAGSGEFHVYRHLRRKEYSRQKYIQEKGQRELLDKEYHERLEENKKLADATTAKKRAKRLKRKEKFKQKKFKINNSMNNQEENSDETDDNNQCSDDDKDEKLNVPHVEETINSNNKIEELNKENLKKNKAQIYIENMDKIGKNTNQSIDNVR